MRLIDADVLIKFIDNRYDITWKDDYEGGIKDACTDILEEIKKMPTIEPERTGRWIRTGRTNIYYGKEIQCSLCGDTVMVQYIEDELYCRHCGARMEVEHGNQS